MPRSGGSVKTLMIAADRTRSSKSEEWYKVKIFAQLVHSLHVETEAARLCILRVCLAPWKIIVEFCKITSWRLDRQPSTTSQIFIRHNRFGESKWLH